MTWNILEIIVYNPIHEEGNIVKFNPGSVNIITGKSHTGKTAILDIINYCLGSASCNISEGVIRDNADWFAVKFLLSNSQLFVAREAPCEQQASGNYMILEGQSIITPKRGQLRQTTNLKDAQKRLSQLIGIIPNKSEVEEAATRERLQATIRHTVSFILQPQYVIANPAVLFANTEDAFKQKALIDTFPYFLGAIPNEQLFLEGELEKAKRDLKRAQRRLADVERISVQGFEKATSLIDEAKDAGFSIEIVEEENDLPMLIKWLLVIVSQPLDQTSSEHLTVLDDLQDQYDMMKDQILLVSRQIRAMEDFQKSANDYGLETQRQLGRLKTVEILDKFDEVDPRCPLCEKSITNISEATHSLKQMQNSIRKNLSEVQIEQPHLVENIIELKSKKENLYQKMNQLQASINQILEQGRETQVFKQQNERKARVLGRISMFLEAIDGADDISPLRVDVIAAQERIKQIESLLSYQEKEKKVQAALDRIGQDMTRYAQTIDLEFPGVPLRLDPKALTVRVQRPGRPLTLAETGSGANWVGYHLVTLLALHKFFITENRPVPAIFIIDQPSQVYFPPDPADRERGDLTKIAELSDKTEDRNAVKAMYDLVFRVVDELRGKLQVIITDHANFKDYEAFQKAIIYEWRDGKALIPQNWIKKDKDKLS